MLVILDQIKTDTKVVELENRLSPHSFKRINAERSCIEYIGYAGENDSLKTSRDDEGDWYDRKPRYDALLFPDKRLLILKKAFSLNPWGVIEGIPVSAYQVNIFVYHAYLDDFHMDGKVTIKIGSRSEVMDIE